MSSLYEDAMGRAKIYSERYHLTLKD